jgi:hypothetical protein
MATRKQRKQKLKDRRHEYEKVWIHSDGTVSEEPPDDYVEPATRAKSPDGKKPQQKRAQSSSRGLREPQPPSWRRATKRALMLGVFIFIVMYFLNTHATGGKRILGALELSVLYSLLFIPFTYYTDRFGYNRWQRKMAERPKKR